MALIPRKLSFSVDQTSGVVDIKIVVIALHSQGVGQPVVKLAQVGGSASENVALSFCQFWHKIAGVQFGQELLKQTRIMTNVVAIVQA